MIAHVDRHGKLSYNDFGPITGLAIAPDGGVYTVRTVVDGSLVARGHRAQILRIDPKTLEAQVAVGAPLANGCLAAVVALTCGDGSGALTARLDSPDSEGLAFDHQGGLYIGGPGQEIRYLPPPARKAIRLGLVLSAAYPEEVRHGHGLSIRYRVSSPDARITLRIARKGAKHPVISDLAGSTTGHHAGVLRWDGRIDGKPAPVGGYLIEAVARSRGRIATRQLVVGVRP